MTYYLFTKKKKSLYQEILIWWN